MNGKFAIGVLLGLAIGFGCRALGVPSPAPPALMGALLVLAMTTGYVVTDRLLRHGRATSEALCGGPTGRSNREHIQ
jgi:XapX domain-containing protein